MENYQLLVTKILDTYKRKNLQDSLICLPVFGSDDSVIAFLRPITSDYIITTPNCVELMSKWRIENPTISNGIFTVTHERTKKWLDSLVINNDKRIIFLVEDFSGRYIGHIGFAAFDYEKKTAEIDSVLRGVKGVLPGLMEHCMKAMIRWGYDVLKLEKIELSVFSDNTHAVEFYRRCGFADDVLTPMRKVEMPDEVKWEPDPDTTRKDAEKYYLKLKYIG